MKDGYNMAYYMHYATLKDRTNTMCKKRRNEKKRNDGTVAIKVCNPTCRLCVI